MSRRSHGTEFSMRRGMEVIIVNAPTARRDTRHKATL
jgi:hypothetical protein